MLLPCSIVAQDPNTLIAGLKKKGPTLGSTPSAVSSVACRLLHDPTTGLFAVSSYLPARTPRSRPPGPRRGGPCPSAAFSLVVSPIESRRNQDLGLKGHHHLHTLQQSVIALSVSIAVHHRTCKTPARSHTRDCRRGLCTFKFLIHRTAKLLNV